MLKRILIQIVFIISCCLCFSVEIFAEEEVGKIENTIGTAVNIKGTEIIPLKRGDPVHPSDIIKTEANSIAKILFFDGANIILYENSELNIKEYKVNLESEKKSLKSVFENVKGKIRFFVKPDPTVENDVKYKTNNAVMGIRGTSGFIVSPSGGETQLVVTTGKVELSNPAQPNIVQEVQENQWGKIIGEAPPPPPEPVTPQLLEELKVELPEGFENPPPVEEEKKEETNEPQQGKNNPEPPPVNVAPAINAAIVTDKDEQKEEEHNSRFKIGPTLSFGVFNFITLGIEAKLFDFLGLSASFGGVSNFNIKNYPKLSERINNNPNSTHIQDTDANIIHFEARAVLYPFLGSFFIGSAIGNRKVDAKIDVCVYLSNYSGACIPARSFLKVRTSYITPQFGWLFMWDSGLTLGTEFGVQIPIESGSLDFWSEVYSNDENKIKAVYDSYTFQNHQRNIRDDIGDYFRKNALPFWNIIKVGWLF